MNIYSYYRFTKEVKMPNRDGTGPTGTGPKTGRGLGPCAGSASNVDNRPLRKGLGKGRGR